MILKINAVIIIIMAFKEKLSKWISLDDKIYNMNEELALYRSERKELAEDINKIAIERNLEHKTIEFAGGNLRFQRKKQTSTLSIKYVQQCLMECISDEEKVKFIMDYIKDNRESKFVNVISRTRE